MEVLIEMTAGITDYDSLFTTGAVPWHGLGVRLPGLATMEEAIAASGLDWTVAKVPLLAQVNGSSEAIPGYSATMRESDQHILGVVKNGYQVMQNRTLFEFCDALAEADNGAVYETAGSLFAGKVVWALMKLPENIILKKDGGTILPYFLGLTSHDGTKALTVRPTPVRVECANTVAMAEARNKAGFVVKHTRLADPMQRILEAQEALGFTFRWYQEFEASANKLIAKRLSAVKLNEFVVSLFPNRKGEDEVMATRTENRRNAVLALAKNAENLEAVRGTAWAAYNAVAEYADHEITYRDTSAKGGQSRADNRAASILDGSAADLKQRALVLLN